MSNFFLRQCKVIAHRGASAYAPENTMQAFYQAYLLGATCVEFDVMLAACGTPVVFHDDTLARITHQSGSVSDYPYAELATFEAGAWFSPFSAGERIPTLASVLNFLKATGMAANIEIKPLPGHTTATVDHVSALVNGCYPELKSRLLFSSFSMEALHHLKMQDPEASLGMLMHEWLPDWERLLQHLNPVSVHLNKDILNAEAVLAIKRLKKAVLAYTVNSREEAEALLAGGLDGVFSDYPDLLSG